MSRIKGSSPIMPIMPTITLITRAWKKAVENSLSAASRSPSPNLMLIWLPAPCPIMKPNAWKIDWTPSTTPIAALALVPSFPTKNASTRL